MMKMLNNYILVIYYNYEYQFRSAKVAVRIFFLERRKIMQKELSLQKLNHIDFLSGSHTKRIDTAYEDICGKVDLVLQEEVSQLAEMTYQERVLDGILFCRQTVEEIY